MSQSKRGDPTARPCEEFRGGLTFIHNIPSPPLWAGPGAWRLGLRLHTALFTEGRFRPPPGRGWLSLGSMTLETHATSLGDWYSLDALRADWGQHFLAMLLRAVNLRVPLDLRAKTPQSFLRVWNEHGTAHFEWQFH